MQGQEPGDFFVDVPLGSSIVRWDVERMERVKFLRLHTDVVSCMLKVEGPEVQEDFGFTFTASEAGEVALWDEEWNVLDRSHHAKRRMKVTHASVSPCGRRVVTTSEYGDGIATVFKIYREDGGRLRIVKQTEFGEDDGYTFVEWVKAADEGSLLVAVCQPPRTSARAPPSLASAGSSAPSSSPTGDAILHLIRLNDCTGEWSVIKERPLSTAYVGAVAVEEADSITDQRRLALACAGRQVQVIDMHTLDTLWTVDASGGSGRIKCLALKSGGSLLCPTDSGRVSIWHRDRLHGDFALHGVVSGAIYYINCDRNFTEAWVINEAGIHICPLDQNLCSAPREAKQPQQPIPPADRRNYPRHMTYHEVTCCGLDFNKEGTHVAVGDFAGNVMVWEALSHMPLVRTRVPSFAPVRCVCWRRSSDPSNPAAAPYVLISCVTGEIYSWNPFGAGTPPALVASLGDTVTCMRWENQDVPRLLAVGTTRGSLSIMRMVNRPSGSDTGQVALEEDPKFGSIGFFAELWSLTWSPDNTAIATCSEDQRTCVWNLQGERLQVLTGHTTAVTGVDWQLMKLGAGEDEEILATCADDQKVMLWNAQTWRLMHVFDTTDDIHEWHTLTYLALQAGGHKLCCVTQSGSVAVWDLRQGKEGRGTRRWVSKLHAGSVEGLAWNAATDLLATCSSDCTVHLLQPHLSPCPHDDSQLAKATSCLL